MQPGECREYSGDQCRSFQDVRSQERCAHSQHREWEIWDANGAVGGMGHRTLNLCVLGSEQLQLVTRVTRCKQAQGLCGGRFHKQQTQCAEQWWLESTLRWGEEQGRSLHMYTGNRGYTYTRHGTGTRVCSQRGDTHGCAQSKGECEGRTVHTAWTACREAGCKATSTAEGCICTLLHLGPTALLPPLSSLPPCPQQLPRALFKSHGIQEWEQVGPHARC